MINSGPLRTMDVFLSVVDALEFFSSIGVEISTADERFLIVWTSLGGFVMMLHSIAIACAVKAKSPVT